MKKKKCFYQVEVEYYEGFPACTIDSDAPYLEKAGYQPTSAGYNLQDSIRTLTWTKRSKVRAMDIFSRLARIPGSFVTLRKTYEI